MGKDLIPAFGTLRAIDGAIRSKYPELFEGDQRDGSPGLDADVLGVENDWAKQRDDEHYRIAEGDPLRIRWLTEQTIEPYHDFRSAWLRAELKKGKPKPPKPKNEEEE